MRASRPSRLALLTASILAAAPPLASAGDFEDEVLAELNLARAHPAAYARELRAEAFDQIDYRDKAVVEDPEAVDDAIGFLMRQAPLPPLQPSRAASAAAEAHVRAQGPRGDVGHGAQGALGRRLQSQGVYAGLAAESISYGQASPRDVVRQLIVDSGVPSRAHRRDLFARSYQVAGVACGPHAEWGRMCVIDYAGALARLSP